MNYRYESTDDSSSDSSSSPSNPTSWITTNSSNDDDNFNQDMYNEPETKKRKRSFSSYNADINETELNYELVVKATYKWVINDFDKIMKEQKTGDKLDSPIFSTGVNDDLKWRLHLYLKGNNVQNNLYTSVFLELVSSKEPKLKVNYRISILNYDDDTIDYFVEGKQYGFRKIVKWQTLFKKCVSQKTDKLVITCDISAHIGTSWLNKIKVVHDLEILNNSGIYSDTVLEVENNKFQVHKCILAARSPVFAAMFQHDMKEKAQNIVKISDIDYVTMKEVLRFIYTGKVENLDINAKSLLAAADQYAFQDLKTMCENYYMKNLTVNDVIEIFNLADLYNITKLKEHTLNFSISNIKEVIKTESFKTVGEQAPFLAQVIRTLVSQEKKF